MFTRRYSRLDSLLHRQASQNAKVQKVFQKRNIKKVLKTT
jgi:hypothetical protein